MQVVEEITEPSPRTEALASRAIRIVLGSTLLLIAALYITLLVTMTGNFMVLQPGMYTDLCRLFDRGANVVVLLGVIYFGLNLLAAPKKPAVFLRRFGLDVNSVVSRVIRKGLGRQFRFVTLDDGRFPAVDIPAFERWASRLGPPIIAILVVMAALTARQSYSQQYSSNGAYAQTAAQMSAVMGFWVGLLWILIMLAWIHTLRVRRMSRYAISTESQLQRFLFDMRLLDRWRLRLSLLRPQAIVAKVTDSFWQQCVSNVAKQFGIAVIDISEPTLNLQWEIEYLRKAEVRCVFIAEKSRLQSWIAESQDPTTTAREGITNLVGEDSVLLYQGDQKLGGAAFRRALQLLLRKAGKGLPRRARAIAFPLIDRLWRTSVAIIFHAFILFVALVTGVMLGWLVFAGTAS